MFFSNGTTFSHCAYLNRSANPGRPIRVRSDSANVQKGAPRDRAPLLRAVNWSWPRSRLGASDGGGRLPLPPPSPSRRRETNDAAALTPVPQRRRDVDRVQRAKHDLRLAFSRVRTSVCCDVLLAVEVAASEVRSSAVDAACRARRSYDYCKIAQGCSTGGSTAYGVRAVFSWYTPYNGEI